MRKSTLILSVVLTVALVAALIKLAGMYRQVVDTAVQGTPAATQVAAATAPTESDSQPQPAESATINLAAAPVPGAITIFEAAAAAAQILGRKDVYITEYAQLDGADVYLVSFLSGDLVYVNLDGEVISTSKQDPIGVYQPTSHQ